MVEARYFKNEYDLAREITSFDQIGDWDQSTVINEVYALLSLDGNPNAQYRDRELSVKRYWVGCTSLYLIRTKNRSGEANYGQKVLTFVVKNKSLKSRVIDYEEKTDWLTAEFAAAQLSDMFGTLSRSIIEYASAYILGQSDDEKFSLRLVQNDAGDGIQIAKQGGLNITVSCNK